MGYMDQLMRVELEEAQQSASSPVGSVVAEVDASHDSYDAVLSQLQALDAAAAAKGDRCRLIPPGSKLYRAEDYGYVRVSRLLGCRRAQLKRAGLIEELKQRGLKASGKTEALAER